MLDKSEARQQRAGGVDEGRGPSKMANPAGLRPDGSSKRCVVMVVDDDDAIREALEDVLGDEGYDVIGASDGQQALELLHGDRRPSAILVDLWMPVMDGWKFLDTLLADPRLSRIPLVVLTAARDQRARDLCVAEVLTKPVQLHQVLGVLERLTANV
jgi:CheY-like chemotaxis protein